MAEWPIEIVRHNEMMGRKRDPIPPGEAVQVSRYSLSDGNGNRRFGGCIVLCPKCGMYGGCPAQGTSGDGRGWTYSPGDPQPGDSLTMRPSILCNSPVDNDTCGGHYWLTDGVLREV